MSLQQLYHTLSAVISDRKTGKIYIYVRENGSKRFGTVYVGLGEILSVIYSQETGASAFERLLSLGVHEVIFMPRSDVENTPREPDAPFISNVLADIKKALHDESIDDNMKIRHELRQDVEVLLKKIYGPGITQEINKIAELCPPAHNPVGFLDQCRAKAMLMLNRDQVEAIFKPLYAKIL